MLIRLLFLNRALRANNQFAYAIDHGEIFEVSMFDTELEMNLFIAYNSNKIVAKNRPSYEELYKFYKDVSKSNPGVNFYPETDEEQEPYDYEDALPQNNIDVEARRTSVSGEVHEFQPQDPQISTYQPRPSESRVVDLNSTKERKSIARFLLDYYSETPGKYSTAKENVEAIAEDNIVSRICIYNRHYALREFINAPEGSTAKINADINDLIRNQVLTQIDKKTAANKYKKKCPCYLINFEHLQRYLDKVDDA